MKLQGEEVKKLDVLAYELFINVLRSSFTTGLLVSEVDETVIEVETEKQGNYIICYEPFDMSSNIDYLEFIGSIFSIYKKQGDTSLLKNAFQPVRQCVAAGYSLYGSATVMVLSTGFLLDSSISEFVLTDPNMRVKPRGNIYSINEGYTKQFEKSIQEYVATKKQPCGSLYVSSMVADVHRTIKYGDICMYPATKDDPLGKLRWLYDKFAALTKLGQLEVQLATHQVLPGSAQLAQLHSLVARALKNGSAPTLDNGYSLLEQEGRSHPGTEGIKRTREQIENREIQLCSLFTAHKEESIRITQAVRSFIEHYEHGTEIDAFLRSVSLCEREDEVQAPQVQMKGHLLHQTWQRSRRALAQRFVELIQISDCDWDVDKTKFLVESFLEYLVGRQLTVNRMQETLIETVTTFRQSSHEWTQQTITLINSLIHRRGSQEVHKEKRPFCSINIISLLEDKSKRVAAEIAAALSRLASRKIGADQIKHTSGAKQEKRSKMPGELSLLQQRMHYWLKEHFILKGLYQQHTEEQFEKSWQAAASRFACQRQLCQINTDKHAIIMQLNELGKQCAAIQDHQYGSSLAAVRVTLQAFLLFEKTIELLEVAISTFFSTAAKQLMNEETGDRGLLEREMSQLELMWSMFHTELCETRKRIDLSPEYSRLVEELEHSFRYGCQLCITVAKKSTQVRTLAEACQFIQEVETVIEPQEEKLDDRIRRISEIAIQLYGVDSSQHIQSVLNDDRSKMNSFTVINMELSMLANLRHALTFQEHAEDRWVEPKFIEPPLLDSKAREGQHHHVHCQVSCIPPLIVSWYRNGVGIDFNCTNATLFDGCKRSVQSESGARRCRRLHHY